LEQKVAQKEPVQQKVAQKEPVQQKVAQKEPVQQKVTQKEPFQQKVAQKEPVQQRALLFQQQKKVPVKFKAQKLPLSQQKQLHQNQPQDQQRSYQNVLRHILLQIIHCIDGGAQIKTWLVAFAVYPAQEQAT